MNSIGIRESSDLFRCVNERIVDLAAPLMTPREFLWLICECPNDGCTQTMRLTRAEYDAMRVQPGLYALVPGHEQRELEEIVRRTDRYVLFRSLHTPATQEVTFR
jgi:hypothetical protein